MCIVIRYYNTCCIVSNTLLTFTESTSSFIYSFKIEEVFEKIKKGITGKPYNRHVMRPYYAIENSLGADDPEVGSLSLDTTFKL